jgi:hypothetical protein
MERPVRETIQTGATCLRADPHEIRSGFLDVNCSDGRNRVGDPHCQLEQMRSRARSVHPRGAISKAWPLDASGSPCDGDYS